MVQIPNIRGHTALRSVSYLRKSELNDIIQEFYIFIKDIMFMNHESSYA